MIDRVRSARRGWCIVLSVLLLLLAGCTLDPNVKKKKYLESGKRYAAQQKYREAAIQFQNALQVDSRYADARFELAHAYMGMGSWQAAFAELHRVVEIQPDNLKARLDLGTILLNASQLSQAAEQADFVLTKDPNNPAGHVLQGSIEVRRGDVEAGLRELELAIKLDPNRAESYDVLAQVQFENRQYGAAEENLKKTISLNPKRTAAMLSLAAIYQRQGRVQEALQSIQKAIQTEPKDLSARVALVTYYFVNDQVPQAEEAMRKAAADLPENSDAYRMLPDYLASAGKYDLALAEIEKLRQEHPKDHAVQLDYVRLLLANNRIDAAAKVSDSMLKDNLNDVDALVARGAVLNRQGRPREAVESLQRALKIEPDNAMAHYQAGVAYDAIGDAGRAETEYREAVRRRPRMFAAQEALAGLALRQRKVDLLGDSAEMMIRLQPTSGSGYVLRSAAEFARKDTAKAEADIQKAIELGPDVPTPYARFGEYRLAQKKYADAEKLFEKSLEKKPDFAEGMQGLVALYAGAEKNLPKALARVSAQIEKSPQSSELYNILAGLQLLNKEPEKAEASLAKAVELDKRNVDAVLGLAGLYAGRGALDKAVPLYESATLIRPGDDRAYIYLGNIYLGKKDYARAEQYYRKVLEIVPDSPEASNNLAYSLLEQGRDIDLALSLAQVARRRFPNSPGAADTLAWAYYKKGAYGLAIDLLEEATKKDPQEPEMQYHLGMAYQRNGNASRAKVHLEKALQLDPNNAVRNAEIRKVLDELKKG